MIIRSILCQKTLWTRSGPIDGLVCFGFVIFSVSFLGSCGWWTIVMFAVLSFFVFVNLRFLTRA